MPRTTVIRCKIKKGPFMATGDFPRGTGVSLPCEAG